MKLFPFLPEDGQFTFVSFLILNRLLQDSFGVFWQ